MATILRKLLAAGAAAALTVGISGCGGDVDQSDHDKVVEELGQANAGVSELAADLKKAQDALAAGATGDQKALLEAEIEKLKLQLAAANADAKEAEATAKAAVDAAAAMAMSDKAKAILAALRGDVTELKMPGAPDSGLMDRGAPTLAITKSSAGVLTVGRSDIVGYSMATDVPDSIAGFSGAVLKSGKNELVVYTDIANATAKTIAQLYDGKAAAGKATTYAVQDTIETTKDVKWAQVGVEVGATLVDDSDDRPTFMGTVRGVPGTFTCTSSDKDCGTSLSIANGAFPLGNDGKVAPPVGTWIFSPTNSSQTADVQDSSSLYFGWWLTKTANGYAFDAFEGQSSGLTANTASGSALRHKATYSGGAAGKYAMASTTDGTYSGGHFTGNAALTADFDADATLNTPGNDMDGVSVSGTISGIKTGDVSRDWTIALKASTSTKSVAPITDAVAEWSTGGAVKGYGNWSANMYGAKDADSPTNSTSVPTAINGEFNAAIGGGTVGRIVGAFAAKKD